MADDFGIKTSVRGIEELKHLFDILPPAVRKVIIQPVTEYLIGDDSHGLKHLVPYRYVSRASAYGKVSGAPAGYFSWRQFRYVMAMIHRPGHVWGYRSGKTSNGWLYRLQGGGFGASIFNDTQGAYYVQGDETQARQPAKVGHRKMADVISTNIKGAMVAAGAAIRKWLKENAK